MPAHGESHAFVITHCHNPSVKTLDHWPAIEDHNKDLDNDGEITTKLISTVASDNPFVVNDLQFQETISMLSNLISTMTTLDGWMLQLQPLLFYQGNTVDLFED